jgi:GxxExxY protein
VIGAAIEVHRVLGPRYIESFYEHAFCVEMTERGIAFVRQSSFPVFYKRAIIGQTPLDLLIDRRVLVELKALKAPRPSPGAAPVVPESHPA